MRTPRLIALLLLLAAPAAGQQAPAELPELHVIKTVTLSPSYSCRSPEDFKKGYEQTALFLPGAARGRNSPALLFNGACRAPDYFQVSTAGAEMSLIADLGEDVELERLTAQDVHHGAVALGSVERKPMLFRTSAPVKWGHTYAVVLNKGDFRGLLFFAVKGYLPNERVDLRYVVKHYESLMVTGQSPGFDWSKKSTPQ